VAQTLRLHEVNGSGCRDIAGFSKTDVVPAHIPRSVLKCMEAS
jgi:hypothetical protein